MCIRIEIRTEEELELELRLAVVVNSAEESERSLGDELHGTGQNKEKFIQQNREKMYMH